MSRDSEAVSELAKIVGQYDPKSGEDVVDSLVGILRARLEELRPALEEGQNIERLLRQLERGGIDAVLNTHEEFPDSLDDEAGIRKPLASRKQEIQKLVRDHPEIRPSEIARHQGLTTSRVSQITGQMIADGIIKRGSKGLLIDKEYS